MNILRIASQPVRGWFSGLHDKQPACDMRCFRRTQWHSGFLASSISNGNPTQPKHLRRRENPAMLRKRFKRVKAGAVEDWFYLMK